MKEYSQKDLEKALVNLGVEEGDILLVSAQLFILGKLKDVSTKDEYLNRILDAISNVIGQSGTLVVQTYSTQTARFGTPFVYEETQCINGTFSQFVLEHPDSIRSLHPINSFCALGSEQSNICENCSINNYGIESVPDRLARMGVKIINICIDFGSSIFMHYLEALHGVPYCYNKLLNIPVFKNGEKVTTNFTANVKYLEYDIQDHLLPIKNGLLNGTCVRSENLGGGIIHCVLSSDYCDVVTELLRSDPFALLQCPPNFRLGEIPYDGFTEDRDGGAGRVGAYKFSE